MTWTPQTIRQLCQLWADGHSLNDIGIKLGVTRNAVVGKAHRLGLKARQSPIKPRLEPLQPMPIYYGKSPTLPTLPSLMDFE